MKKSYLVIILALVVMLMSSCQPTPQKEIVVNKADGGLQEIIEASPAPTQEIEVEERWITELQKDNVYIHINAEVVTPNVHEYSILSVNPITMNQEWIDKSLEVLFKGVTPYEKIEMTKQSIEKRILNNKKVMDQINTGKCPDGFTEESYDLLYQENKVLLKIHENATDENDIYMIPSDTSFKDKGYGLLSFEVAGKVDKPDYAQLYIMNNSSLKWNSICFLNYYDNDIIADVRSNEYSESKKLNGISITLKEAQQIADETITKMGIMGVDLIDIKVANIFTVKPSIDVEFVKSDKQAYEFVYERNYNGINVTRFDSLMMIGDTEQYSAVLDPEKLIIWVDDSGIVYFQWKNPTYSDRAISENVELIGFDKIKEIFNNNIFSNYFIYDPEGSMNINIDKIVLSYYIQPEINNNNEYVAIPVWDFIGSVKVNEKSINTFGKDSTILTINAIDGSIINRALGN